MFSLLEVILACYVVVMATCFWSLYCNNKTNVQLQILLNRIGDMDDVHASIRLLKAFDVRKYYSRHHLRLLTFRDPWAIYPDELANLMRVSA